MNACQGTDTEKIKDVCRKNPDLEGKKATSICDEVEAESDALAKGITDSMTAVAENWNPIVAIANAFKSKARSEQSLKNRIAIIQRTETITSQDSRCTGSITQSQSNVINAEITEGCINSLRMAGVTGDKLVNYMQNAAIRNVVQTNTADARNTCAINLVLEALTSMEASVDNTIMQKAMNKAKGLASNSESNQKICNDISSDMSACKYIAQTQCCEGMIKQDQDNTVTAKCGIGITDIVQNNASNAINICQLDASASVSDTLSNSIKNALVQTAENTSEGLTFSFWIIFIVIGCVMFAGFIYAIKYMMGKALYILGGILILVGIGMMIGYFTSGKPSKTRYNQPFVKCGEVTALTSALARSTFGKVKKRVQDSDVIGYDFYIDINKELDPPQEPRDINPKNINDNQTGTVLYITGEPNDDCNFDDPLKPKDAVVSYIKGRRNKGILIGSICLIIGGIGSIIAGVIKDRMSASQTSVAPTATADPSASADSSASTDPSASADSSASTDSSANLKSTAGNFFNNLSKKIPTKKV